MSWKINNENIKDWAKNYKGEPFDAILCDPPYELGFMGKSWDSSGIAFDVDMWADLLRILKPGGHLLAFSGSRTYHRMACAIEDAGLEIRDMIEWVYGSGFPKSLNIGKAVDKIQGNEREVVGELKLTGTARNTKTIGAKVSSAITSDYEVNNTQTDITKGTSLFEGYGTALKPAHEPCVLARKPIEGTVAQNALKYGTGGLNIDGSRVKTSEELGRNNHVNPYGSETTWSVSKTPPQNNVGQAPDGRFPANLIHDGSDEVVGLFPDTKGGVAVNRNRGDRIPSTVNYANHNGQDVGFGDSGSAARFFYTAKASKSERNAGLDGFEKKIRNDGRDKSLASGHMPQNRSNTPKANHHPTVKPLSLTKYLATLIKPPTEGRLLVPFSGSGSEMIGAIQAGWNYVEGVELTEEYIPIAEARIKYWLEQLDKEQPKLI